MAPEEDQEWEPFREVRGMVSNCEVEELRKRFRRNTEEGGTFELQQAVGSKGERGRGDQRDQPFPGEEGGLVSWEGDPVEPEEEEVPAASDASFGEASDPEVYAGQGPEQAGPEAEGETASAGSVPSCPPPSTC